jgi:hypothetical protein
MKWKNFKSYQSTGLISKISYVSDKTLLHTKTTDVIIYANNNYIEMLKDGKFLYRPSGIGQGKRSRNLENVELYMYKELYGNN